MTERIRRGDVSYACSFCERSMRTRYGFRMHSLRVHGYLSKGHVLRGYGRFRKAKAPFVKSPSKYVNRRPNRGACTWGQRSRRFNDTTGAISWNYRSANLHPDRCTCQEKETGRNAGTPHKHYPYWPYACARCLECRAYEPAVP